jgi:hypothetical protein
MILKTEPSCAGFLGWTARRTVQTAAATLVSVQKAAIGARAAGDGRLPAAYLRY